MVFLATWFNLSPFKLPDPIARADHLDGERINHQFRAIPGAANLEIEKMSEVRQAKRNSLRCGMGVEIMTHVSSEKRLRAIWRNMRLPNGFCQKREYVIIISISALPTLMWNHFAATHSNICVACCLFSLCC